MDNPELKRLHQRLKAERVVTQREALKDHALKMTRMQNRKLRAALVRLRQDASRTTGL